MKSRIVSHYKTYRFVPKSIRPTGRKPVGMSIICMLMILLYIVYLLALKECNGAKRNDLKNELEYIDSIKKFK